MLYCTAAVACVMRTRKPRDIRICERGERGHTHSQLLRAAHTHTEW